jgi:hypothetical protein
MIHQSPSLIPREVNLDIVKIFTNLFSMEEKGLSTVSFHQTGALTK